MPGPEEAEWWGSKYDLKMGQGWLQLKEDLAGWSQGEDAEVPRRDPSKRTSNGCCPMRGRPFRPRVAYQRRRCRDQKRTR